MMFREQRRQAVGRADLGLRAAGAHKARAVLEEQKGRIEFAVAKKIVGAEKFAARRAPCTVVGAVVEMRKGGADGFVVRVGVE